MKEIKSIVEQFDTRGTIATIKPLGNGLINDTFLVKTEEAKCPDYVLQRINHMVFQNVEVLQANIEKVTAHIRHKLESQGETDIDRKVLTLVPTHDGQSYYHDGENYWRITVYIPRTQTIEVVNPSTATATGEAFGQFQAMLADIPEQLGDTIPDFHNIEFRLQQLRDAISNDKASRVNEPGMQEILIEPVLQVADQMCEGNQWLREGKIVKRICHCDPKVNNILFDENGQLLCVIDLDTVMPSFIYSDFGDFLRTAANFTSEDDADLSKVGFNMDIFKAFSEGYLREAKSFLTDFEIATLPYGAALFPYMQCVRFLADYLNGDTYYKIKYPEHNLVRAKNQLQLFHCVQAHTKEMTDYIKQLSS